MFADRGYTNEPENGNNSTKIGFKEVLIGILILLCAATCSAASAQSPKRVINKIDYLVHAVEGGDVWTVISAHVAISNTEINIFDGHNTNLDFIIRHWREVTEKDNTKVYYIYCYGYDGNEYLLSLFFNTQILWMTCLGDEENTVGFHLVM